MKFREWHKIIHLIYEVVGLFQKVEKYYSGPLLVIITFFYVVWLHVKIYGPGEFSCRSVFFATGDTRCLGPIYNGGDQRLVVFESIITGITYRYEDGSDILESLRRLSGTCSSIIVYKGWNSLQNVSRPIKDPVVVHPQKKSFIQAPYQIINVRIQSRFQKYK